MWASASSGVLCRHHLCPHPRLRKMKKCKTGDRRRMIHEEIRRERELEQVLRTAPWRQRQPQEEPASSWPPRPPDWNMHWYASALETWPTCTWTEDALRGYRAAPVSHTERDASDPLRLRSTAPGRKSTDRPAEREGPVGVACIRLASEALRSSGLLPWP